MCADAYNFSLSLLEEILYIPATLHKHITVEPV